VTLVEQFSRYVLNVTLVEHFIQATLLYGLFLFSQRITFRPFKIGLQKKISKNLFLMVPGGKGLR